MSNGTQIVATGTVTANGTSAFSAAQTVADLYTVINTNPSGAGSLNQAIVNANVHVGLNTITFAIPGAGVHTISPTSALPGITDPVVIDGYTQPGASPNTLANGNNAVLLIELDGTNAGSFVNGLTITAGSSTVRGLVINRFGGNGVAITGSGASNNVVLGNFIGTDATGERAVPNRANGVLIDGSSNNTIGGTAVGAGNVISGNSGAGVHIDPGATKNLVQGNFIGTDATGKLAVPNVADGVLIGESSNNTIGGTAVGAGNVISYNRGDGVSFSSGARSNVVQGNNISVNSGAGVSFGLGTTNNVVQGNMISGNIGGGVSGPGAANNLVQGNLIPGNGEPSLPPPNNTQPAIQLVPAQNSSLALIATLVVTSLTGGESQGSVDGKRCPEPGYHPVGQGRRGCPRGRRVRKSSGRPIHPDTDCSETLGPGPPRHQ